MDGVKIKAQLWILTGRERNQSAYCRGADGAMIIYDVTNPSTFKNVEKWMKVIQYQELRQTAEKNIVIMIVGNKIDKNYLRQVDKSVGQAFALKNGATFIETSAKDGSNVQIAFDQLLKCNLPKQLEITKSHDTGNLKKNQGHETHNKCW